jgi:hypothetical protein
MRGYRVGAKWLGNGDEFHPRIALPHFGLGRDLTTVGVGFNPRTGWANGFRRGATGEDRLPRARGCQASLRDAFFLRTRPWAEAHGYRQSLALRGYRVGAKWIGNGNGDGFSTESHCGISGWGGTAELTGKYAPEDFSGSQSDRTTAGVGFKPRMRWEHGFRRGATGEARLRGASGCQASLRDANSLRTRPWAEAHGYHQSLALRGCRVGAEWLGNGDRIQARIALPHFGLRSNGRAHREIRPRRLFRVAERPHDGRRGFRPTNDMGKRFPSRSDG